MNIVDLKIVAKEILTKTRVTLTVWGEHGIGKDDMFRTIAAEEGIGYIDNRLSQQEPGDIIGLPDRDRQRGITRWLCPEWFPSVERVAAGEFPERGILALQELNRAEPTVRQAVFQLIEKEHRIHTHQLAPGWSIVVTLNPPTEQYDVAEFDAAFLSRSVHIIAYPSVEAWLDWARNANIHGSVREFIRVNEGMLAYSPKNAFTLEQLGIRPNPRRWHLLAEIMEKCQIPKHLLYEVSAGIVGPEAAKTYVQYLENEWGKPVKAAQIFENYDNVRETILSYDYDILNVVVDDVIEYCRKHVDFDADTYFRFIDDLPMEFKFSILKRMIIDEALKTRMHELVQNHPVSDKILQDLFQAYKAGQAKGVGAIASN